MHAPHDLFFRSVSRLRAVAGHLVRTARYRRDIARGGPAGDAVYRFDGNAGDVRDWILELRLPADRLDDGRVWAQGQTLERLSVRAGAEFWSKPGLESTRDAFFFAPGRDLGDRDVGDANEDDSDAAFAEGAALILAAEDIDAVVFSGSRVQSDLGIRTFDDLLLGGQVRAELRALTVFRSGAWSYDPETDSVRPTHRRLRVKLLVPRLVEPDHVDALRTDSRRGSYLANYDLGARAELRLRDASRLKRIPPVLHREDKRPRMLVVVPFLARGGAEHTIFATLEALKDRWHISFVTLAPHRPELDDRRGDFQAVWPRVLSLGDWVHPAAMPGMLCSLLDALEPDVLYNANSTTLFFDFLPALRSHRPSMRIVDHLYDHRVGYIERYADTGLRNLVDAIVSENRRIRDALGERYRWPAERAPVVWPCGRLPEEFPADADRSRAEVRAELELDEDDVVILTAARMHEQKRPFDLVHLAERVRDLPQVRFLVVGGGPLEGDVDAAVQAAQQTGARIERLPFRDDIPRLVQACDAGCLVSNYEGLPVFLLECLQAGRPFLGTDVGDLGYVLRATGAGWVVDEPGDLDALERAVRELASDDERRRRADAALRAAPRFSVEASAERYDAVFRGQQLEDVELGQNGPREIQASDG